MSKLLASVNSVEEALLALEAGADIIDLKNPLTGALGALPLATIQTIVAEVAGRKPVSATIGDLPLEPQTVLAAVEATRATGVDIIKIGFFAGGDAQACLDALHPIASSGLKLVAVLLADQGWDSLSLSQFSAAGFHGVMLDTAGKNGLSLLDHMTFLQLQQFVDVAHRFKLLTGLAGSLREEHVASLVTLEAGYLGFRGALCKNLDRCQEIDKMRLLNVKQVLHKYNEETVNSGSNRNRSHSALHCTGPFRIVKNMYQQQEL